MTNIFREAKHLLDTKKGSEMTPGEAETVATAMIPLMVNGCPFPDITIGEGLLRLARIVENNERASAGS